VCRRPGRKTRGIARTRLPKFLATREFCAKRIGGWWYWLGDAWIRYLVLAHQSHRSCCYGKRNKDNCSDLRCGLSGHRLCPQLPF
jgi:hypothetical protein